MEWDWVNEWSGIGSMNGVGFDPLMEWYWIYEWSGIGSINGVVLDP